jgi:hypothetical protein
MPDWFNITAIVCALICVLGLVIGLIGVVLDSAGAMATGAVIFCSTIISFIVTACIVSLVMAVTA